VDEQTSSRPSTVHTNNEMTKSPRRPAVSSSPPTWLPAHASLLSSSPRLHKPAPSVFPRGPSRKVIDQGPAAYVFHSLHCRYTRAGCLPSLRTGLLFDAPSSARFVCCPTQPTGIVAFLGPCSWALGCVRGAAAAGMGRHGFGAPGLCPCAGTWAERLPPFAGSAQARCVLPRGRWRVPGFWVASTVGVWDGRVGVCHVPLCATLGCSGPRGLCLCREMEPRALEIGRREKASTRRSNPSCAVCISPNRFFAAGVCTRMCLVAEEQRSHRSPGVNGRSLRSPHAV